MEQQRFCRCGMVPIGTAAGYYPPVILSGRRINGGMGGFVGRHLVKLWSPRNDR